MYQTNPTEMLRERQLALRREIQEWRSSRSSREALPKRSPRSGWRRMAAFGRQITLSGRTKIPIFRA